MRIVSHVHAKYIKIIKIDNGSLSQYISYSVLNLVVLDY